MVPKPTIARSQVNTRLVKYSCYGLIAPLIIAVVRFNFGQKWNWKTYFFYYWFKHTDLTKCKVTNKLRAWLSYQTPISSGNDLSHTQRHFFETMSQRYKIFREMMKINFSVILTKNCIRLSLLITITRIREKVGVLGQAGTGASEPGLRFFLAPKNA